MLNYSATATQVVTCARRFLQRFNPGPRDSARAFYSLLGAVAMGAARAEPRMEKTVLCEEFHIRRPPPTTPQLPSSPTPSPPKKCQELDWRVTNQSHDSCCSALLLLLFISEWHVLVLFNAVATHKRKGWVFDPASPSLPSVLSRNTHLRLIGEPDLTARVRGATLPPPRDNWLQHTPQCTREAAARLEHMDGWLVVYLSNGRPTTTVIYAWRQWPCWTSLTYYDWSNIFIIG